MKNRTCIIAYILIIAFYAALVCLSIVTRSAKGETAAETAEQQHVAIGSDSLLIDWHLLLPDEPKLMAEKKAGDTLRANIQRYKTFMLQDADGNDELPLEMLMRTDCFEDFMLRFNGDSATLARFKAKMDFSRAGQLSDREAFILMLTNSADALEDKVLRKFAADIAERDICINAVPDANFLAVATIAYKDNLSGTVFPVRLTIEQNMIDDAPVWYVVNAESPYLTYGDDKKPYYIDFAENEIMFMGLARHADRSAKSIAGPTFEGDGLSAFLALTSKGFITYQHADYVQYLINVGDYTLLVEHVESYEHMRSGYLITRIVKDSRVIFASQSY